MRTPYIDRPRTEVPLSIEERIAAGDRSFTREQWREFVRQTRIDNQLRLSNQANASPPVTPPVSSSVVPPVVLSPTGRTLPLNAPIGGWPQGPISMSMAWADCDHDCEDPEELKAHFWNESQQQKITKEQFESVVFIFAKDRIENWIEFLTKGSTDESKEGPRVKHNREAADAAKKLAKMCSEGKSENSMPPSLLWSRKNWQALCKRTE